LWRVNLRKKMVVVKWKISGDWKMKWQWKKRKNREQGNGWYETDAYQSKG